ncbi:MAG: molecular chaperone HtpG [Kiritimatiellia bacterium]|jgi:molecular chaperone HtpG|nr:molecular chaperone HtpG [Kiritimatiellia bacterium]MDP6847663.1 molecular chaperone HtpG [Kiritimatiellia bacterium]
MAKKTRKFKTEVQQLLDIVIHSLYSKKEIYLRELLSNASDAIDRARFESLTDKSLTDGSEDWKIKIVPDKEARTLAIIDNGVGMNAEEIDQNLGTIANSGTRNFLESLKNAKDAGGPEFIGQFGVGFYASFMVADKVTVLTKRAGKDQEAILWTSDGTGKYSIEQAEKEAAGTEVTLHFREDMDEFLEEWKIRGTVKEYSDYVSYPITMDVERKEPSEKEGEEPVATIEEETLNSMKAIWKKAKSEVSEEEYNEFYKHVSHDYTDPLRVIHYIAEGTTEFRALLYIPSQAPFDLFFRDSIKGIHLYVKNVYITDDCKELLPEYLRFVRGVVDSSDLPLNVSREMLQDDAIIRRIRKSIVGKILSELSDIKDAKRDDYLGFYNQFGKVLKEGVHSDFENHDKLKDLVMFRSTSSEDENPVLLRDYVDRMPSSQKEIYYITSDSVETAASSPHLEAFKEKGYEVLFFVDPIDEWIVQRLTEYDGKKLKAVDRGDIDFEGEDEKADSEAENEAKEEYKDLLDFIQKQLDDDVKEVRLSKRLTDSVCCLVADEAGMNANMERIMRAMNQDVPKGKRILELNPGHDVLKNMKEIFEKDKDDQVLADFIDLVYGQALIAEGSQVKNPSRFAKLVSSLMVGSG